MHTLHALTDYRRTLRAALRAAATGFGRTFARDANEPAVAHRPVRIARAMLAGGSEVGVAECGLRQVDGAPRPPGGAVLPAAGSQMETAGISISS
jgi:hypothetical protein